MRCKNDEEVSIEQIKAAIKDYHAFTQGLEVKRAAINHEQMWAWGNLQKILSNNTSIMRGYDECHLGD